MRIELPWSPKPLELDLPDTWEVVRPSPAEPSDKTVDAEIDIVAKSLSQPSGATPLPDRQLAGKKVVIVVDDNTRPTPADRFFQLIRESLAEAGAAPEDLLVIPALGIHTPMSQDEMAAKIGRDNLEKVRWENHRPFKAAANYFAGTTSRGTPVYLNRHVVEADLVVLIGLIEPHLMAGFGGGLKNILPGVASAETIGRHHEILSEPPYQANRVGMFPEENSFRLDLEETRSMLKADIFCVNVILNRSGAILACFAGDPVAAHRQGVDFSFRHFGLRLERPVDGVITNAYPMDINFKQSMKCVGNALPALKPGGVVMGFLRSEKGLDDIPAPDGSPLPLPVVKTILRLIGSSRVYGFLNLTKKNLDIEEKFLYYYTFQLIRQYELFFYVPALSPEIIKALFFFKGFTQNPQEVIDRAARKLGPRARVAVFPEGGSTFSVIKQQ
ncbi:MAG: nickel-dependent lactate racemase [Desulfosudaceae bacterium]